MGPQKFLATKNWVLGSDWFSLLKGERRTLVINQAFQNLIKEPKRIGSLGEAVVLKPEVGPNKKVCLEASERKGKGFACKASAALKKEPPHRHGCPGPSCQRHHPASR